jgi:RNA polymerase sigma-70 factor
MREHEAGLLAFIRSCVDDVATADDLVQETFWAAWQQLDQFDPSRPFARWLRGIARNKILGHFRSASASGRYVNFLTPEALEALDIAFDPFVGMDGTFADCMDVLRECLLALHRTDHEIIQRVYREDQTCGTVADQMGQSIEVIKKRLQRARARLRDCILSKLGMEAVHG